MKNRSFTLILAPLQGFTDMIFRNTFARHFSGMDEAVAPFISTMGQQRLKPARIRDVDPKLNPGLPVVPQILGNVAGDFIFLADRLAALGHDRINWNLGCPHSKIAKKKRGSGLLLFPEEIDRLLSVIIPNISTSLSVKIRLGRKSGDEIHNLIAMFDNHDLEEIILHPRTGVQMYQGDADLDAFGKAMEGSRHEFTYNGDITDRDSFFRVRDRFPRVRRFMIGRGILANPFLAEELRGTAPENPDRLNRLAPFHEDLFKEYEKIFSGPGHLIGRMKGFWNFLGPSFKDSRKPLKKILKSTSVTAYTDRVDEFFRACPEFMP
ncbi:tRNA dihydrouridine synthase [Desulfospira joergensenii]|uniref:tRNA dihydrouridine synthase n=1 Tax=Desulfospira joergensenii TaxID=53329 RepID=UPI0003B30AAD|nr:tRNA-dihydrouridine synthase family protein [Desulfospira joergensenii]